MKLGLLAVLAVLVFTPVADAHLIRFPDKPKLSALENRERSQHRNLLHAAYVCEQGAGKHKRWACKATVWLRRELKQTRSLLYVQVTPTRIGSTGDACLDEIIDRETAGTWDPGIWNYSGSGAFGLPQALPYTKLPKAGWPKEYGGQEDPHAQVEWMRGYVNGRYGGSCSALDHHNRNGWY